MGHEMSLSNLKIISVDDLSSMFDETKDPLSDEPDDRYKSDVRLPLPDLTGYQQKMLNFAHKRFQCEQCGKSYTQMSTLRRHQTYDCGKPANLKCDFCDYRTKYKFNLIVHVDRRHTRKLAFAARK